MFKIGEIVVHKRDVCTITDIVKNYREGADYYRLVPLGDTSLVIHTPVINKRDSLRKIMTRAEAEALIDSIPTIDHVTFETLSLASEYRSLIDSGSHTDLICAIKTAYLRQEDQRSKKGRINENDKVFFRIAEKIFYSELSAALGISYAETKELVTARVKALSEVK